MVVARAGYHPRELAKRFFGGQTMRVGRLFNASLSQLYTVSSRTDLACLRKRCLGLRFDRREKLPQGHVPAG
eukprot:7586919-Lingulodinium_polyedra.AAC.1